VDHWKEKESLRKATSLTALLSSMVMLLTGIPSDIGETVGD